MHGKHLWVYDEGGKLLIKVKGSFNRMYKLIIEDHRGICLLTKANEQSWLWHSRLGYVNFQALNLMSREGLARGLLKLVQPKEICN